MTMHFCYWLFKSHRHVGKYFYNMKIQWWCNHAEKRWFLKMHVVHVWMLDRRLRYKNDCKVCRMLHHVRKQPNFLKNVWATSWYLQCIKLWGAHIDRALLTAFWDRHPSLETISKRQFNKLILRIRFPKNALDDGPVCWMKLTRVKCRWVLCLPPSMPASTWSVVNVLKIVLFYGFICIFFYGVSDLWCFFFENFYGTSKVRFIVIKMV